MARNESKRFNNDRDHALFGAGFGSPATARHNSWRALASGMVAAALMVAAVVSAFALVDAIVAPPSALIARKAPAPTEQEARRACVLPPEKDVTAPMQVDPALFTAD
jgi:hypothetical protein